MHHLSIDLETYSSVDIQKAGAQKYFDSDDFEILLFAYSVDFGPVEVVDMAQGEELPSDIVKALYDPMYIKHAYNAAFEFGGISKIFGKLDASQWQDTMLLGLYSGYTGSLGATGAAIGLPEDKRKLTIGKALIKYFCKPCAPTKSNGGRTRNYPYHEPEKWALFKEYNGQDVVTEMAIYQRLKAHCIPYFLQKQWETDLKIYLRGVAVDMTLVHGALKIGAEETEELRERATQITGLANPNSVQQLARWIQAQGIEVTSLTKDAVSKLLDQDLPEDVRELLEIRQKLGKTSTKKYDAICSSVCKDGRVRGLLQFYGANRTGRWAGRLVQVQNLPRTYVRPIEFARELVQAGNKNGLKICYGNVNDTLSQLVRTAFVAAPGNVLVDADFSAIEARVISWLAGESWRLEVFRTHGKIYEASASQMFGVPIELIKKGNPEYALRAKGKVAELALGYQGSSGALIQMGALDMGLTEDELPEIVNRWREANPKIKNLWYAMQSAAEEVIQNGGSIRVGCVKMQREYDSNTETASLVTVLPSGRKLYYVDPGIGENRFGGVSITYMGLNQTNKSWQRIETYGGKLVENTVQAIARDCLAEAIDRLEAAGYPIVFHVHDEVVIDIKPYADPEKMLQDVVDIMKVNPVWAQGLPLNADGWVGGFFTKD